MVDQGIEQREAELDVEADVERILAELGDALQRIRSLGTLLTVCGDCKCIRDSNGQWCSMEHFLGERLRLRFSHGLCPDCGSRLLTKLEGSAPGLTSGSNTE